jgi:tetratricopeptide (TPR) repeat protein
VVQEDPPKVQIPTPDLRLAGDHSGDRARPGTGAELVGGAAILVLLVAAFHGPSLGGGFVYDDHWTVEQNAFLRAPGVNLPKLLGPGPARAGVPDAGRPVMVATEMLDFALWRLEPRGYHLQNLVWHAGVGVLFFLGAAAFTGSFPVALAAAALFAVHPVHVEAVAAVNYREDLLAAFFVLAALLVLGAARRRGGRRGAARAAACTLLLVGALAKESAMMAPVLLVVLELSGAAVVDRAQRRDRVRDVLAMMATVLAVACWRTWVMGAAGTVSQAAEIPAAHRAWLHSVPEAARSLLLGTAGLLLPVRQLAAEYDELPATALAGWLRWGSLVLVAVAATVAWRARRNHPLAAVGVLGACAAYLPTFGLLPITNLRADRYLYLPSLPILLATAAFLVPRLERLPWLRGRPWFEVPRAWVVLAALVAVLGLRTRAQGRVWRDDVSLWTHATQAAPRSPRAWNALGEARLRLGQPADALAAVHRSLALVDDPHGRELLGIVLLEQGDLAGAHDALERALAGIPQPHRAELLNNLGACELEQGSVDSALRRFAEARRLAPRYDRPWLNAARALRRTGRLDDALALLRDLVQGQPESFDGWAELGVALESRGDLSGALAAYRRALALGAPAPEVARAAARLSAAR